MVIYFSFKKKIIELCVFEFLGQITEDDEKLLEEETASPANLKRYKEIKKLLFLLILNI
jgi:hypothetical protein